MRTIPSTFSRYSLTTEETLSGTILNDMQLGVLHNMRTDAAEQKINLVFTPNDVLSYTQQEAFLKGQIDLITALIDASAAAQKVALNPSQDNPT